GASRFCTATASVGERSQAWAWWRCIGEGLGRCLVNGLPPRQFCPYLRRAMPMRFVLFAVLLTTAVPVGAQSPVVPRLAPEPLDPLAPVEGYAVQARSGAAAFGLSLLVPGLGHRYANGAWGPASSAHAVADAALWVGLIEAGVRLGRAEDSYETLAALRADAEVEGQGRGFFLNLSRYRSSEDYVEALLRERRWNELEEAQRPEN